MISSRREIVETKSVYAFDKTYPVKYDAATVIVTVVDVNDHEPILTKPVCAALSVPENVQITKLHTLIANDGDDGHNGLVTYEIIGIQYGAHQLLQISLFRWQC